MGLGSQGTVGLRPATGRTEAARSRGPAAPRPGQAAADIAGRLFQRHGHRAAVDRRTGDLGTVRIFPRPVRRTRRRAAVRQACAHRAAGSELSSAISDRNRAVAEGAARLDHLDRHDADRRPGAARQDHARRAGREPDAHRRREYRRCRFHRAVADQAGRRRQLSLQHPESRRHREGGRRKRDARSHRPLQHPADPDRRPHHHRGRRAGPDAEDARQLRLRHLSCSRCRCRRSIRRRR